MNMYVKENTADSAWKIMKMDDKELVVYVLTAEEYVTAHVVLETKPWLDSNQCMFWWEEIFINFKKEVFLKNTMEETVIVKILQF